MHIRPNSSRLSLAIAAILMTVAANSQERADDGIDGPGNEVDIPQPDRDDGDAILDARDGVDGDFDDRNVDDDERAETAADAQELVDDAVMVVNQMRSDPEVAQLLDQARGVFIIPDYAQAAAVIGGQGGEGIALIRQTDAADGSGWTSPAFFNYGGATFGAAAGVEAGAIAMLLMSDEAVDPFRTEQNNFSLDASAGLTIVDYSARAEASAGRGDVVVWSDTEGAFGGLTIGISDINRDDDEIAAFYGENVGARQILSGMHPNERARNLRDALSG